ncbi:hypothetical protein COI_0206 [Mannheimia haemolytica serotype A2 str. OVINE]|nr:hypothetical protein COI_0206 [Mannheimia haemolytica serotype A2 str. OVINE]
MRVIAIFSPIAAFVVLRSLSFLLPSKLSADIGFTPLVPPLIATLRVFNSLWFSISPVVSVPAWKRLFSFSAWLVITAPSKWAFFFTLTSIPPLPMSIAVWFST